MKVQVRYVGICGSDILRLQMGQDRNSLGHEIVAKASDSYYAVNPLVPCHSCSYCVRGQTRFCRTLHSFGKDLSGGYAGRSLEVPDENLIRLATDDPVAYVLSDPLACVMHGLRFVGKVEPLRSLVVGDGTMGILYSDLLEVRGARPTTVIKSEQRVARMGTSGRSVLTFTQLEDNAYDDAFDVGIVAVGGTSAQILNVVAQKVRSSGTLLIAGAYHTLSDQLDIKTVLTKELGLRGLYSYEPADFSRAVALIGDDEPFYRGLVTDVYPAGRIDDAFTCHSSKAGRIKVAIQY